MTEHPPVVVVLCRCSRRSGSGFGIRFERTGDGAWHATWAFTLKESVARREGYDRTEIEGSFVFDATYPGCPTCGQPSLVRCGRCHGPSCWDGERVAHRCPWCGNQLRVEGCFTSLRAGGDR